uniref:Uncharacterized protein n=1 Tax=uncultured marine virus TaxID=186617 RepID=A0A0F7L680_9VIRU|nr:hypothetical protein [uncultured marine virus]
MLSNRSNQVNFQTLSDLFLSKTSTWKKSRIFLHFLYHSIPSIDSLSCRL